MSFTNAAFRKRRAFFDGLIKLIDLLPNSFQIVKKWNESDHAKFIRHSDLSDGSCCWDVVGMVDGVDAYFSQK